MNCKLQFKQIRQLNKLILVSKITAKFAPNNWPDLICDSSSSVMASPKEGGPMQTKARGQLDNLQRRTTLHDDCFPSSLGDVPGSLVFGDLGSDEKFSY